MGDPVKIRFPNASLAEANHLAGSLEAALGNQSAGVVVKRIREDDSTQDFGATIGIILAGPAVVAIAKGMQIWLQKHHGVEIEIETSAGKVRAANLTEQGALDLLRAHRG